VLTSFLEQAQLITCLLNFSLVSRIPWRIKGERRESREAGLKTLDPVKVAGTMRKQASESRKLFPKVSNP